MKNEKKLCEIFLNEGMNSSSLSISNKKLIDENKELKENIFF